jgi:hydrocephalus-inducing protein
VINPKSTQVVNITLKTEILSSIRIPLYVKIEGYHIPFMITILATSIGPIVSVNKQELEYNNVEVLKDYIEKIVVKNESKIPAEYTAFTKNKESVWKVIQRHGVLNPDEEKEIEVVCNADEVQKFTDTLHIIINNGDDLEVKLNAKGIGSTLYCKDNLNVVDFGTEYTFSNITKEFFLENRGRKQMKI